MKLRRRTEAIADLENSTVHWDVAQGGVPYRPWGTREIHLPNINELDIDESNIEDIRGYCDHELRHVLHSEDVSSTNRKKLETNSALHNIRGILEDARVERIEGRRGEKHNLKKLRTKMSRKIDFESMKDPEAAALSAFMYRSHDIYIHLNEAAEEAYKRLSPLMEKVFETDANGCIDVSEEVLNTVKDMKNEDEQDPQQDDSQEEEKSQQNNSQEKSESSQQQNESSEEESSEESEEESSEESEEENGDGENEDKTSPSNSNDTGEKGEEQTVNQEESEEDSNSKEEADLSEFEKELENNNTENMLKKEISEVSANEVDDTYSSYNDFNQTFTYKYDPSYNEFNSEYSLSGSSVSSTIGKKLAKVFRSKTDVYRKHGLKKGKKLSKNRISLYSEGMIEGPFYEEENTENIDAKISILIDMSGSMRGVLKDVFRFMFVIAKALHNVGVDFEVIGSYNCRMNSVRPNSIWDSEKAFEHYSPYPKFYEVIHAFGEQFKPQKFINICMQVLKSKEFRRVNNQVFGGGIYTGRNFDDSEALYEVSRRLEKAATKNEKKIIFFICDGNTEAAGCDNRSSILTKHLTHVVEKVRNTGIDIFTFGFGNASAVPKIYGESNSIYVKSYDEALEGKFINILNEKLLKALK